MLPIHPMLALLLQGGAVPGRWLAEVRQAGDRANRFVDEGWNSLEPLGAVSYSALLASPLGGGGGALAAALAHLEQGEGQALQEAGPPVQARDFGDPVTRPDDPRDGAWRAAERGAPAGRSKPLPPMAPTAPRGPISPATAAARLAQRAAASGLETVLRRLAGSQPFGPRDAAGTVEAQAPSPAWSQVFGVAPQAAQGARRSLAVGDAAGVVQPMIESPQPLATVDAARRLDDAVERALQNGAALRRSRGGHGPAPGAVAAAADRSWSASEAQTRARQVATSAAHAELAVRGEPVVSTAAQTLAARTASQGLTGLRGLAARAAVAGLDAPMQATRRGALEAVTETPARPAPDEAPWRPERAAPPAAPEDEQLAVQLARVLRREAERDGIDVDDVLP